MNVIWLIYALNYIFPEMSSFVLIYLIECLTSPVTLVLRMHRRAHSNQNRAPSSTSSSASSWTAAATSSSYSTVHHTCLPPYPDIATLDTSER